MALWKRALLACGVVILSAGLLVAADNSWNYPVPTLGGLTTGGLIYARSPNALGNIDAVASGQVLTSAGTGTIPAWSASPTLTGATISGLTASKPVFSDASKGLTSSGTMPVNQGGTNQTSYATGDMLYASAATTLSKLSAVASGQVLASAGVNTAPAYTASPSVTAITTSGTATLGDAKFARALVSVGAGASAVLNLTGGSGPTTALQNSWLQVLDSTGTTMWIPVWK